MTRRPKRRPANGVGESGDRTARPAARDADGGADVSGGVRGAVGEQGGGPEHGAGGDTAHLHPSAAALLALPDRERIARIDAGCWIGYPAATRALTVLDDLMRHPPSARMPNRLLVAETNNGKTEVIRHFLRQHPPGRTPDGEHGVIPVLAVQAPPRADAKQLYHAILQKLFSPYSEKAGESAVRFQTVHVLRQLGTRLLVLDEFHNLLEGSPARQRAFLIALKHLANELEIALVAAGTQDALNVLATDPQLENRFEPLLLPRWREGEGYGRLLASFERLLPLRRASELDDPQIADRLLLMAEGTIGATAVILRRAARAAITSGRERITLAELAALEWVPPSERRGGR